MLKVGLFKHQSELSLPATTIMQGSCTFQVPLFFLMHVQLRCSLLSFILPSDPSLSTDNVSHVMEGVIDLYTASRRLHVPASVCLRLHIPAHELRCLNVYQESFVFIGEKGIYRDVSSYWKDTVPSASWESLAGVIYSLRENKALQRVREFLPKIRGAGLGMHTVCVLTIVSSFLT